MYDDYEDYEPVWPAWAVGALLRGARCMMIMKIISPFGQLGLWAPSSGVRDVFTSMVWEVVLSIYLSPHS
jgi:hypothetical protein